MMVRCNKWNQCQWKHCEHFEEHEQTNVCDGQCPDNGEVHCEEVLDEILTERHKAAGLWLTEAPADPRIVNLIGDDGHVVKSFSKPLDPELARQTADEHLKGKREG